MTHQRHGELRGRDREGCGCQRHGGVLPCEACICDVSHLARAPSQPQQSLGIGGLHDETNLHIRQSVYDEGRQR